MRLIDADALKEKVFGKRGGLIHTSDIDAMPTAQPDLSTYSDKLWKAAYERGKAEAQQRWIPVSERLPEEGVEVLCCFRNGNNYKIIVSKRMDFNYWSSVGRTDDTIAWMPLPEAYQGEGDGK